MSSEKDQQSIPSWDGSARSWRRYTREVCWYVRGTAVEKRRYLATKLVGRLKGPARLLAMSWTTMEFDHTHGVRDLLQRLAASPLVRQTLPNAAAICQQYFNFKRDFNEPMNNFLVREALGYAEFVEALLLLYEDKNGVKQHEKSFDLPEEEPKEDQRDGWYEWNYEDDGEPEPADGPAGSPAASPAAAAAAAGADGSMGATSPLRRAGATGAASVRSVGVPSSAATPLRRPGDSPGGAIDEFSLADSFVLGVLRGFRLLQSAGLSAEDKRDILASTKGSLEFSSITQALQTLWDEQFLSRGHGSTSMRSPLTGYFQDTFNVSEETYDQTWWTDEWGEAYWADDYWPDYDWDQWGEAQHAQPEVPPDETAAVDDPQLQDSLQAEREAESLALQAQRTWAEAQRATAALRRDRGFGQHGTAGDKKCYVCGSSSHFARDCPDKLHPSNKGKGKGKFNYNAEWENAELYYMKGKGKSKGKFKGKGNNMLDAHAMWKGKGKSKTPSSRPAVNAYMVDNLYGMELKETFEAQSTAATNMQPNLGLLDCGATASAGPETSVQKLISSVLAQDHGARVTIAKYMRPFFRFGNGCWGQANFRVSISSTVSGSERTFHMYCLPDPKDGDKRNLVPVLLGMDHLSGKDAPESALTIDFHTGLAIESMNPQPHVHQLPSNTKGHYVRDIVDYLTQGFKCEEGSPTIHVLEGTVQSAELQTLEFHPVEFYDMTLHDSQHDDAVLEKSRQNLLAIHSHLHAHQPPSSSRAASASMCPSDNLETSNSKLPASSACNGPGTSWSTRTGQPVHLGSHQDGKPQGQGSATLGYESHNGHGQQGSQNRSYSVAMLRSPHGEQALQQRPRSVDSMRNLQPSPALCAKGGKQQPEHQGGEPLHGAEDAQRVATSDAWGQADSGHMPGHAKEDRCGGSLDPCDRQGADEPERHGLCCGRTPKTKGFIDKSIYSCGTCANDTKIHNNAVGCDSFGLTTTLGQRHHRAPHHGGEGTAGTAHDRATPGSQSGCSCIGSSSGAGGLIPSLRGRDGLNNQDLENKNFKFAEPYVSKELYNKVQPLTSNMATKVMMFASTMIAAASATMMDFTMDGRDGLWEVACAPHSWLSQAAEQHGLRPRRINLQSGFDLYQPKTWEQLDDLRRRCRPKRIWWSLPCTRWCSWTSVNYSTPEKKELLETYRRKDRKLLWHAYDFLKKAIQDDPEIILFWEWPHPCYGWSQEPMLAIEKLLQAHGHEWLDCRIDGCRYHMRDHNGDFLKKKWKIKTNDENFHSQFRAKVCVGAHCHGRIEGQETAKSAYYPWQMVQSIARFWVKQEVSNQQLRRMDFHDVAEVDFLDGDLCPADAVIDLDDDAAEPSAPASSSSTTSPTEAEREQFKVKLLQFHKAAGHCSGRNLARIVRDAKMEPWKIKMAMDFRCPTCDGLRPGGISSGNVPPAATHAQFGPWEAIGLDVAEWYIPLRATKQKFLMVIDMCTRLRAVFPVLDTYDITVMKTENAEQVIEGVSKCWLGVYPKPHIIVADNAKSFTSVRFGDFCREAGIELTFPAEKEAWAHGLVEHAIKDLKFTASAIQTDSPEQNPKVTLVLAASALNSTEYVSGFSSHQWAFGRDYMISDEDRRNLAQLGDTATFSHIVLARQRAEDVAVKTRANRILGRLANSKARQPLRNYGVGALVKIWRRVLPQEVHTGPRGGLKKASRPGWVGPGRVIFSERLPHQDLDDERRHIVWILMGGKLLRCSVHSVRPVTPTEKLHHELNKREDITQWKSLTDIIPAREFTDISDEIPSPDQLEEPFLPPLPDGTTIVPGQRVYGKKTVAPEDWRTIHRSTPLGLSGQSSSTYGPGLDRAPGFVAPSSPPLTNSGPSSASRPTTSTAPRPEGIFDDDDDNGAVNDYGDGDGEDGLRDAPPVPHPEETESKRLKSSTYDLKWVEQLEADAALESGSIDVFSALQQVDDEVIQICFDLELSTNRQRKMLERQPVLFLAKKLNGAEVQVQRLSEYDRSLFQRAKTKEVTSFLKNEAVRKCLSDEEVRRAYDSNRIIRARWVLTWKCTPPDEIEQAKHEAANDPETVLSKDGSRKAKARIVLLGFQHPSLLDRSFKTSAPVQSMIGRNLIYLLAVQEQWEIHGLDLATAFLQTQPTEADAEIWTTGVAELRAALGIPEGGLMRVLRNIYGSTTAPRGLWLDLHKTLVSLGATPILGERCLWAWFSKTEMEATGRFPRLLGVMGGHVDDFHCCGNFHSSEWQKIYNQILAAYKWGTAKRGNYRHAGTDLKTVSCKNSNHFKLMVDQDAYVESVADVAIPAERLYQNGPLQKQEIGACRTALGALQWLAIQTQPQLCARCNLLLTEVVTNGTLETAREIQQMISEVRAEPFCLEFSKLPGAKQWNDIVFISMGDQSHSNRPQGDSTGGMVTLAAGPDAVSGKVVPMTLISWRTWKLKRKAIGSNDAEVQSILEAEDQNFRVRMLWSELHGAGFQRPERRPDLVKTAEEQAALVTGILCTDSRGGYDAVEVNESPLLGLSNMRAALQAFQLRDNLKRVGCELRWLASDYDLADAFTKKRGESRLSLLKYMKSRCWSIAFDPNFVAAKRNKKTGKTAIQKIDDALGDLSPPLAVHGAYEDFSEHALAIIAHEFHLHDLQHELAISDESHVLHAIHAGSRDQQTETCIGSHFPSLSSTEMIHDLNFFCAGAAEPVTVQPLPVRSFHHHLSQL